VSDGYELQVIRDFPFQLAMWRYLSLITPAAWSMSPFGPSCQAAPPHTLSSVLFPFWDFLEIFAKIAKTNLQGREMTKDDIELVRRLMEADPSRNRTQLSKAFTLDCQGRGV